VQKVNFLLFGQVCEGGPRIFLACVTTQELAVEFADRVVGTGNWYEASVRDEFGQWIYCRGGDGPCPDDEDDDDPLSAA